MLADGGVRNDLSAILRIPASSALARKLVMENGRLIHIHIPFLLFFLSTLNNSEKEHAELSLTYIKL